MTEQLIEALKVAMERATPGPWSFDGDWHRLPSILGSNRALIAIIEKTGIERSAHTDAQAANAALIVAMRNALPELLAAHKAMADRIEALEAGLRGMLRLADMGFAESMAEPEEHGNYVAYNRANALLNPPGEKS